MHKRSAINLVTAISYQFINTLMGLFLPYLFITEFGSETNGFLSSITQLFVYVSLLEGGVGGATVQALYKPISQNDRASICGIMSATSRYYLKTGVWYGGLVILLSLFYPLLVYTEIPRETVRVVILLQGASGAWSYVVQGKYSLLLKADGRMYIINTLMLGASILKNAGKILAIAWGYDIIAVQIVHFAITVLQSMFVVAYAKRNYVWLDFKARPDFESISQRGAVLVQQITWLIFNHTDVIILTLINKNLILVSVYSLYTLVFSSIQNLVETSYKSIHFRMGEYAQKQNAVFAEYCCKYRRKYMLMIFTLLATAYLLLKPFMQLYVGNVADGNYLMRYLPELFVVYRLLYLIRDLNIQIINAVGHFRETKKIALMEAGLNLVISICLAPLYNIYGVLLGTISALTYSCITYIWYTCRKVLGDKEKTFYFDFGINVIVMIIACWLGNRLMPEIKNFFMWIKVAIPVTIIIFSIFGIAYICNAKRKSLD